MSKIPPDLKYTETHEWARLDDDGNVTIGITDHAQGLLGDVVYIELPEVDTEISSADEIGVVESVKAAADVYCPIGGTVVEVNEALAESPQLINTDPYGAGWLYRLAVDDEEELNELLDADGYAQHVASEEH